MGAGFAGKTNHVIKRVSVLSHEIQSAQPPALQIGKVEEIEFNHMSNAISHARD